ncbi:MAG TPA: hypothetical protein PLX89_18420 [Verrucomicrobiota bacterium]|nr:hypothetical protein [Verrucomicrobiota bacterium]
MLRDQSAKTYLPTSAGMDFPQALSVVPFLRSVRSQRRAVDNVEFSVRPGLRMQRQPKEPALFHALVDRHQVGAQIQEKRLSTVSVAVQQMDDPALLSKQHAPGAIRSGN